MVAKPRAKRQEARDLKKSHTEREKKLHAETKRLRAEAALREDENDRIMDLLVAERIITQDLRDDLETTVGERVRALARINRAMEWGEGWRDRYQRRRDAFNQLLGHFNALEAREYIHTHRQTFAMVALPDRLEADSWLRESIPDPRLWGTPAQARPLFFGFGI